MSTLSFRNVSFQDLKVATAGELNIDAVFPAKMSKWKRFVSLSEADLEARAAALDAWTGSIFSQRAAWTDLVQDAMKTFVDSALLVDGTAPGDDRRSLLSSPTFRPLMMKAQTLDSPYGGGTRKSAAFLSHFKWECGTEASAIAPSATIVSLLTETSATFAGHEPPPS